MKKTNITTGLTLTMILTSLVWANALEVNNSSTTLKRMERIENTENRLEERENKVNNKKEDIKMRQERLLNATNSSATNTKRKIDNLEQREIRLDNIGSRINERQENLQSKKSLGNVKKGSTVADTINNLNNTVANVTMITAKIDTRLATSTDSVKIAQLGVVKTKIADIKLKITALNNTYSNMTATSTSTIKKAYQADLNVIKKLLEAINKDLRSILTVKKTV